MPEWLRDKYQYSTEADIRKLLAIGYTSPITPLDDAVQGYKDFDKGAAKKFVLDPHKSIAA